jgi:hypothetical protein
MSQSKAILLLMLYTGHSIVSIAQANNYPTPAGVKPSADYKVFVNGKEAFVYASPVPAAYCCFEINGKTDIEIKASRDIKWVDIRPLSLINHFI